MECSVEGPAFTDSGYQPWLLGKFPAWCSQLALCFMAVLAKAVLPPSNPQMLSAFCRAFTACVQGRVVGGGLPQSSSIVTYAMLCGM